MIEDKKRYTIFCDIDGCIFEHGNTGISDLITHRKNPKLLDGVLEKFDEWNERGYCIIITTARKECLREYTTDQLFAAGIHYDQLVMGISHGPRIIINDTKPGGFVTAYASPVERNKGLGDINI
jgi:hypothetical protein